MPSFCADMPWFWVLLVVVVVILEGPLSGRSALRGSWSIPANVTPAISTATTRRQSILPLISSFGRGLLLIRKYSILDLLGLAKKCKIDSVIIWTTTDKKR
jgi:hypothetical protein